MAVDQDFASTLKATHYKNPTPILIIKEGAKMVHIVFEYMDAWSHGEWNRQECTVSSVEKCIDIYGLGKDCDYRIISVEEVNG